MQINKGSLTQTLRRKPTLVKTYTRAHNPPPPTCGRPHKSQQTTLKFGQVLKRSSLDQGICFPIDAMRKSM